MIKAEKYQHPRDGQLLGQLLKTDASEKIFEWCKKNYLDEIVKYSYDVSCLEVTSTTVPEIYEMISKACEMFGVTEKLKCFIIHTYDEKIELTGLFTPILLLSDEYINHADESNLYGTIASQIAGLALGHQKGVALSWLFENCSGLLPIPAPAVATTRGLLNQWKRCRQFSCDRACLLTVGDYTTAIKTLFDQNVPTDILDRFEFGAEHDQYEEQCKIFEKASASGVVSKAINSFFSDRTWIPDRYKELKEYYLSDLYRIEGEEN